MTSLGQVNLTGIESTERKDLLGDQMNIAPLTEQETFFKDAFRIALSKRVMWIGKDQGLDCATGRGEGFFQGRNKSHTKSVLETGKADQDRAGGGPITAVDIIAICTPELRSYHSYERYILQYGPGINTPSPSLQIFQRSVSRHVAAPEETAM